VSSHQAQLSKLTTYCSRISKWLANHAHLVQQPAQRRDLQRLPLSKLGRHLPMQRPQQQLVYTHSHRQLLNLNSLV